MKQILDKLSDDIENQLPESKNYILLVFPEGSGEVNCVSDVTDFNQMADRLRALLSSLENNTYYGESKS